MTLKEWRRKKNITQAILAADLRKFTGKNLPQNTISSWENGKMPRKFWLIAIADYTNKYVMAEDFFYGK